MIFLRHASFYFSAATTTIFTMVSSLLQTVTQYFGQLFAATDTSYKTVSTSKKTLSSSFIDVQKTLKIVIIKYFNNKEHYDYYLYVNKQVLGYQTAKQNEY